MNVALLAFPPTTIFCTKELIYAMTTVIIEMHGNKMYSISHKENKITPTQPSEKKGTRIKGSTATGLDMTQLRKLTEDHKQTPLQMNQPLMDGAHPD